MKICLQAGHIHIESNADSSLHGSTGAPGEQEFTQRIVSATALLLQSRNFEVTIVDANANSNQIVTTTDWNLFVSVHYDADVYKTGGGFVDYPDPSIDAANEKSKALANAISAEYFKHSEIIEHPERSNPNTKFYYMWRALSAATPCVIIECGVGGDAHDKVLLADTQRIASALARGICAGFAVIFDDPTPPPNNLTVGETTPEAKPIENVSSAVVGDIEHERAINEQLTQKLQQTTDILLAIQAQGINTADELIAERNQHHATIEGYTTQLTQVLARNKELAESLARKEEEDATAIDQGIKWGREAKSLKDDLIEIRKALNMGTKYDFNQLYKKIMELKSVAQLTFRKAKTESAFDPGISAPPVEGQATDSKFWQSLGLGSFFTLVGFITTLAINGVLHH